MNTSTNFSNTLPNSIIPGRQLNPNAQSCVSCNMSTSTTTMQDQGYHSGGSFYSSIDYPETPHSVPKNPISGNTNQYQFSMQPVPQQQQHQSFRSPGSDQILPGGDHRALRTQPNLVCSSLTVFSERQPPTPVEYLSHANLVQLLKNAMHEVYTLGAELDKLQYDNYQLDQILTAQETSSSYQSPDQFQDSTTCLPIPSTSVSTQVYMTDLLTEQQIRNYLKPDESTLQNGIEDVSRTKRTTESIAIQTKPLEEKLYLGPSKVETASQTTESNQERFLANDETSVKQMATQRPKRDFKTGCRRLSTKKRKNEPFNVETQFEKWSRDKSGNEEEEDKEIKATLLKAAETNEYTEGMENTLDNENSKLVKTISNEKQEEIKIKLSNPTNAIRDSAFPLESSLPTKLDSQALIGLDEVENDTTKIMKENSISLTNDPLTPTDTTFIHSSSTECSVARLLTGNRSQTPMASGNVINDISTTIDTNNGGSTDQDNTPCETSSSIVASLQVMADDSHQLENGNTDFSCTSKKMNQTKLSTNSLISTPSTPTKLSSVEILPDEVASSSETESCGNQNANNSSSFIASSTELTSKNPIISDVSQNSTATEDASESRTEQKTVNDSTLPHVSNIDTNSNKKSKKSKKKPNRDLMEKAQKESDDAIEIALQENREAAAVKELLIKYLKYIAKIRHTHFAFVKERPSLQNKVQDTIISFWENNISGLVNIEQSAHNCLFAQTLNLRIEDYKYSKIPEERKLHHFFINMRSCLSESALRKIAMQDLMFLIFAKCTDPSYLVKDIDYFNMVQDFENWKPISFNDTPVKAVDIFNNVEAKYINHLAIFINVHAIKRSICVAKVSIFFDPQCGDSKFIDTYRCAMENFKLWGEKQCATVIEERVNYWLNYKDKTVDHEMFIAFYDVLMGFKSDILTFDMYILWNMLSILENDEERSWTIEATFIRSWFGYESVRKPLYSTPHSR